MLIEITAQTHPVHIDLRYATINNFTKQVIYTSSKCLLHKAAVELLEKAIVLADRQNLTLKLFDGFRPQQAQEILWSFCPDETYIMNPQKGSVHTRGVAIDLTLVDRNNQELDMGTPFDDFTTASHHGAHLTDMAERNRYTLLGIMTTAGFDFYRNEWWHYQLFNASRDFPLITDHYGIM